MNVGFPKAQDLVSALGKVGIASLIPIRIRLLYGVQRVCVDHWVGVPKVAVPLDDQPLRRVERINNELAANDLLLLIRHTDGVKNGASSLFEHVGFLVRRKAQHAIDSLHISMVIATTMRTVFDYSPEPPSRYIKGFFACYATLHNTAAACANGVTSGYFFCFGFVLPNVRTFERTERNSATATGHKLLATVAACMRTALVAPLGEVGARHKQLTAFGALTWFISDVFHTPIIPWSVAKCTLS